MEWVVRQDLECHKDHQVAHPEDMDLDLVGLGPWTLEDPLSDPADLGPDQSGTSLLHLEQVALTTRVVRLLLTPDHPLAKDPKVPHKAYHLLDTADRRQPMGLPLVIPRPQPLMLILPSFPRHHLLPQLVQ